MKEEIKKIQEKNNSVEIDKAWEKSITRRSIIAVMTYIIIVIFLWVINAPNPILNAIIPAAGFIISTLTLPLFKKIWLQNLYKNQPV